MRRAVSWESAPFIRTVRCLTVAKTLSIGFDVRKWSQCSAGKSKKVSNASRSLIRHSTALSYLGAYFSAKVAIAAPAEARSDDNHIWRRSLCALGCSDLG